jgi:hypothetical protein
MEGTASKYGGQLWICWICSLGPPTMGDPRVWLLLVGQKQLAIKYATKFTCYEVLLRVKHGNLFLTIWTTVSWSRTLLHTHFHRVPRLRILVAILPLHQTSSWCGAYLRTLLRGVRKGSRSLSKVESVLQSTWIVLIYVLRVCIGLQGLTLDLMIICWRYKFIIGKLVNSTDIKRY